MGAATAVRGHGLMFKGPLVRAILDGRKVQTRRLVKPMPSQREWLHQQGLNASPKAERAEDREGGPWIAFEHPLGGPLTCVRSRFNVVDRIWVRETWQPRREGQDRFIRYRADQAFLPAKCSDIEWYTTTDDADALRDCWRPAVHLPKWASRLWLEITALRVERLQDISAKDAEAEGAECRTDLSWAGGTDPEFYPQGFYGEGYIAGFRDLWDSLASEGTRWSDNPWVEVIEFRRAS